MSEDRKRNYILHALLNNVEVRTAQLIEDEFEKDGKKIQSKYIDIKADDENLNRIYLKDKNLDNLEKYKRGTVGTFKIAIICEEDFKKTYKILVEDFIED